MKTASTKRSIKLVIIGGSAGGINTLKQLLTGLNPDFDVPVIAILHRLKNVRSYLEEVLQPYTHLKVKEAEEKEKIQKGFLYLSPSNYHLLIESDMSISLSVDEAVNFSRPSIDVSFVSAAEVLEGQLLGIILTGASNDGAKGLKSVYEHQGQAWVQEPGQAQLSIMPKAAIDEVPDARVMSIDDMCKELSLIRESP